MRKFEKISYKQFKKDIKDDKELYNSFFLPQRKTKYSAGYDIVSLIENELLPGDSIVIPTGFKCIFPEDEFLMIVIRCSLGIKYGIKLANQAGIIDADYYNNVDNEGHILVKLENTSKEPFKINIGDRIAQGIFIKYNIVDNEEEIKDIRKGGFGSTTCN
ncbi:MAG: dUTP diphosphatase [Bacilli bacterium]|nr:dUTP diphosphatase [Bacilli bacterium]MDD4406454.1 dUTP diphosphatase [Bacilli bacterium]